MGEEVFQRKEQVSGCVWVRVQVVGVQVCAVACACWGVDEEEVREICPTEGVGGERIIGLVRFVGAQTVGPDLHCEADS